ncbi:deoxyhypusine synthase-like isoform X2 [Gouania willdenowi]|uniref:deoxyhypusine synthase-like isoform X2 n=1 Tax=Gouania willdenowi TaxID=441366 RepID=UPI001056DA18|nr:deoxyhypusine synthase-like isoform X2 [Gouania willdenowi]
MEIHNARIMPIYRKTVPLPDDTPKVRGYDFNNGVDHRALLQSYFNTGLQASNIGVAMNIINSMVDILVTTAGGIEEDLIKCMGSVYMGDFTLPGKDLFKNGINRIGNMLMPDENYTTFQKWMTPILEQMLHEQTTEGTVWTPSKMIHRFGKEINNPDSICYWAYKNEIPIFSPALTDGAIGDLFFLFSVDNPGLILDIIKDIWELNIRAVTAESTGLIVLGGGLSKHQICNANAWRNGAEYAVYINTAQEFDGCDSGARPDEAVSWGKITAEAQSVKVFADASIVFPLIVAETFARHVDKMTLDPGDE